MKCCLLVNVYIKTSLKLVSLQVFIMNSSAPPPPSSSSSSSPASTSTSIRAGKQTQLNSSSSSPPPPPFTLSLRSPELQAEFLRGNLFLRLNFVLMDNWTEPETGPWGARVVLGFCIKLPQKNCKTPNLKHKQPQMSSYLCLSRVSEQI